MLLWKILGANEMFSSKSMECSIFNVVCDDQSCHDSWAGLVFTWHVSRLAWEIVSRAA